VDLIYVSTVLDSCSVTNSAPWNLENNWQRCLFPCDFSCTLNIKSVNWSPGPSDRSINYFVDKPVTNFYQAEYDWGMCSIHLIMYIYLWNLNNLVMIKSR